MKPTELNSELLSASTRGRKDIPFAVFAVVLIHVVLFAVLLIAAGCRSSARAKASPPPAPSPAQSHPALNYQNAAADPSTPAKSFPVAPEPVVATEPVVENDSRSSGAARPAMSQTQPARQDYQQRQSMAGRSGVRSAAEPKQIIYTVQSGDTLGEIAKQHGTTVQAITGANKVKGHLIFPGQQLVIEPQNSSGTSTAQVKKSKSKEV